LDSRNNFNHNFVGEATCIGQREVNIKTDSTETGCEDMKWNELAQKCVHCWDMVLVVLNILLPKS